MSPTIVRKTISFPAELAQDIARDAQSERRRFSPHVIKKLEELFCASNRLTVGRNKRNK